MLVERKSLLGVQTARKGRLPTVIFPSLRDASPQLRHEIWSRSARAALPPLLGFLWIPLAESGLFNGLQRIQIKNFFSLANLSLAALN